VIECFYVLHSVQAERAIVAATLSALLSLKVRLVKLSKTKLFYGVTLTGALKRLQVEQRNLKT